jgi:hypothetical protein
MSKSSTLILLGIITILAPLSGFPGALRSFVTLVTGALVLWIGLSMRSRAMLPAPVGVPLAATVEDAPVPDAETKAHKRSHSEMSAI